MYGRMGVCFSIECGANYSISKLLQSIHLCTSKLLKEIEEGPFKTYYYHHLMHPRARKTFGVSLAGTCRLLACNQTDIFLKM